MEEKLVICSKCSGNACSEMTNGVVTIWICMGCGFTSNTTITDKNYIEMEGTLPELYKTAGLEFNFSPDYVKTLMDFTNEELEKLYN